MQKLAYGASLRARVLSVCKLVLFLASLGVLVGQAFALGSTTTSLSISPASPVGKSQSVTLSATVVGSAPTGNVSFMNGSTNLGSALLNNGSASFTTSFSTKGSYSLTAVYSGDSNNAASTSSAQSLVVGTATTTTLTLPNPPAGSSFGTGQSVSLSAAVSGGSATGTISFYDGSTLLGNGTVASGSATYAASFATAGSHSITAVYSGDANNGRSTSTAQNLNIVATSVSTVTLSANPLPAGQSDTLTDTVTGNSPGGSVTFYQSGTSLGKIGRAHV